MAYLVMSCILEKRKKGLMTRSLVPSCEGNEDRLLAMVRCTLKKLKKGFHVEGGKTCYWWSAASWKSWRNS